MDCVKQKLKNYGIAVIPKVLVKAQYEYIRNEILKSVDTSSLAKLKRNWISTIIIYT